MLRFLVCVVFFYWNKIENAKTTNFKVFVIQFNIKCCSFQRSRSKTVGELAFLVAKLQFFRRREKYILGYLDTWSGFEAAKAAPWPSRGLHHFGKFLEPLDE